MNHECICYASYFAHRQDRPDMSLSSALQAGSSSSGDGRVLSHWRSLVTGVPGIKYRRWEISIRLCPETLPAVTLHRKSIRGVAVSADFLAKPPRRIT